MLYKRKTRVKVNGRGLSFLKDLQEARVFDKLRLRWDTDRYVFAATNRNSDSDCIVFFNCKSVMVRRKGRG